jgi:hypothetical protein
MNLKISKKPLRKVRSLRTVSVEELAGKFDAPCNPTLAQAELAEAHAAEFPLSRLGFFSQGQRVRARAATYEREAMELRERALQQIQ